MSAPERFGRFERGRWTRAVEKSLPVLCWIAASTLVVVCAAIVIYLLVQGLPALSWKLVSTEPAPSLVESLTGGIKTPIGGTIILLIIGTVLVIAPALGAAIYLSEYMREDRWLTKAVRLGLEVLAGVPSVVFGMFGIAFFALPAFIFLSGTAADSSRAFGRSFAVGAIVLAVHILPFVSKVMEEAIRSVPSGYRQAAAALGMPKWAMIRKVILPSAAPGIMTAIILGMGLIAGDTAIVKLCVGDSMTMTSSAQWWMPQHWLATLTGQGSTLTTYTYYAAAGEGNSPVKAFASAFLLIIIVLVLNVFIEWLMRRRKAASEAK
jgi:phosphate transport system permease protein